MTATAYTVVTFAPVQGFIEKSRKLRDLYGGSFILSYLAKAICEAAEAAGHLVISPAIVQPTQGTPNQIVLAGDFPETAAREALLTAWRSLLDGCRRWVERHLPQLHFHWEADWRYWSNDAWEIFWGQGADISAARQAIARRKQQRDWRGINWQGESSTLSGADAIAWHGMSRAQRAQDRRLTQEDREIRDFYQALGKLPSLGEAFADDSEQLSLPELVKRLVTYEPVTQFMGQAIGTDLPALESTRTFKDVSAWEGGQQFWFMGDGDRIGEHLRQLKERSGDEASALSGFSRAMLDWGHGLSQHLPANPQGRIIYAGGDDFLGVLWSDRDRQQDKGFRQRCLDWLTTFPDIWAGHGQQGLTVSAGIVIPVGSVPQREVLQHCREAEKAAKQNGRDRVAIRVLYSSGNHVQWCCPWSQLTAILLGCRDDHWTGLLRDVQALRDRHADQSNADTAKALFDCYFPSLEGLLAAEATLFDSPSRPGQTSLLGPKPTDPDAAIWAWIQNLAWVGFQLRSR